MLRSTLGWATAVGAMLVCVGCGSSSGDDTNDDVPKAGTSGASAGRAGSGPSAGRMGAGNGGAGSGGVMAGGHGGTAGSATGARAGSSSAGASAGNAAAGAGQGGTAAGSGGGGRGGVRATGGAAGALGEGGESGALQDLDDTVDSACGAAVTCCTAQGFPTPLSDCASLYSMRQPAVLGIMAGHISIDAAALARCKAAYAPGPDQCNLNAVVAACAGVFVGHQGAGEPCVGVYDCDRSMGAMACFITDTSGEQPVGTCHEIPHGQLNAPCFSTCESGGDCSSSAQGFETPEELTLCFEDEGLYCDRTETDAVCHALLPLGEPCESAAFEACGSKAVCETTCQARVERGEACGSCLRQFQCVEGVCEDPVWANESACMGYPPGP